MNRSALALAVVAAAVFIASLLIGPRVPDDRQEANCVKNVHVGQVIGLSLNCDSFEILDSAVSPSRLLNPDNPRQSRPALILAAHVLSLPFKPIAELLRGRDFSGMAGDAHRDKSRALIDWLPPYVAFILLNLALLAAAGVFHLSLVERSAPGSWTGPVIGSLYVFSHVVKGWMWSPHMMLLIPVAATLCVWAARRAIDDPSLGGRGLLVAGLGAGLGMAGYPVFILFPAAIALPTLLAPAPTVRVWGSRPLRLLPIVALFALPAALWWGYVEISTGGFSVYEAEKCGEMVWLFDAWKIGPAHLLAALADNLIQTVGQVVDQAAVPLALATAAAVISPRVLIGARRAMSACGIVAALAVAFVTLIGYVQPRLSYLAVAPLIVAAGILSARAEAGLRGGERAAFRAAVTVAVLGYGVFKAIVGESF